jgi:hypothetical protein
VDESFDKAVLHQISELKLNLSELKILSKDASKTDVKFEARIGEHGTIKSAGTIIPLLDNPTVALVGKLSDIDLTQFTEYSARAIGYRIDSGNLTTDFNFKLENNQLDTSTESRLEKFELSKLQEHELQKDNKELGIPLPLALDLLRDSDNNIELEIPIKGDLDNPDLSISSIISMVTFDAVKNAVIYNYSPLGMLSLASGIFNLATALRFDPLEFEYSTIALTAQSKKQLDKVSEVMKSKPKVKFLICGVATEADWSAQKEHKNNQQTAPTINIDYILKLANQRQQNVLDYLTESHQIEATRLIACKVKVSQNKDDKAFVKLSI